jgi:hypothetical protein
MTMARDVNNPDRRWSVHDRRRGDYPRIRRRDHHRRRTWTRYNNRRRHYDDARRGMTDDNVRQGREWQTDANINATGM